jgi:hypothetical protein
MAMPPAAGRRPQAQAQGRGRGVLRGGERAQHEKQGFAALRGQVQAPQGFATGMVLPEQQGTATAAAQHLLGRPQSVRTAAAADPHQLRRRQAERGQGQRLRRMGRLQHDDAAPRHLGQGRLEQAQLADAGLLQHEIDEAAGGPAIAGQLGRQDRMAGVDAARAGMRQLRGEPQRRV